MVVKRFKNLKQKRGYKSTSTEYQNQHEILGGKGMIYTTPHSNGNYYFRTWVAEEKKYVRKGLKTKVLKDAIKAGEGIMLNVMTQVNQGHKIFGLSWDEVCQEFLKHTNDRVETNRITEGRFKTISTQVNRWIVPYLGKKFVVSGCNRHSFMDYGMYRRQKTNNAVEDVTIRNEYTTVNAICKFAYRMGFIPFEKFHVEEIKINEIVRRDTFSPEEYKVFYTRLRTWVKESYDSHEKYYRSILRDFILLKSNTFCRFGELRQLKWNMTSVIDYEGEKCVRLDLPKEICKNKKDRTVVARGARYLERIKEYSKSTKPDDYVFVHKDKNSVLSKSIFYKYWPQIMEFTGMDKLDKTFTYYSLRHFGITARLMAKVPHYEIAKIAGTNVTHIENHYEHLDMGRMIESAMKSYSINEYGFIINEEKRM